MGFNQLGVPAEQRALLKNRNFGIRPLSTAGHLSAWRLLSMTWQAILIYIFTLLLLTAADFRFTNAALMSVLYYVGLALLMLVPVVAIGVLVAGVVSTRLQSRVRFSAAVYWSWWPFWRFMLCVAAAACGTYLGNALWNQHFLPYTRLARLQAYSNIDPRINGGKRLQDAGVVSFNASAGVDRTRAGCLKNGATYCVAPIIIGKDVVKDLLGGDAHPTQDLFMAGVDCCDCPGEFRCGDWDRPLQLGGLRVFDATRHSFYTLAAQDWSATLHRSLGHPLFFEWTAHPMQTFQDLNDKGNHLRMLAFLAGPSLIVLATIALNGLLALLCRAGLAAPIETPVPPPGLGRAMRSHFMPHMHYNQHKDDDMDPKYLIL